MQLLKFQRRSKAKLFLLHRSILSIKSKIMSKRTNYIIWEEYFMGIARLSAERSKDPKTQVGACIVNEEKRIVGVGYNGMPNGCSDDQFPWEKSEQPENSKHSYVCHAELNAIVNAYSATLKGATLYCTLFPCNECAKLIVQSGITKVIFLNDKGKVNEKISVRMFENATPRVMWEQYTGGRIPVIQFQNQ